MKKTPKTVGERIKFLRKKHKLTQTDLGKLIHLSQKAISKIETDNQNLNIDNLTRIAEYFNVSTDYICFGIDNDSILSQLEKYISFHYENLNFGINQYKFPVLTINQLFFDYLVRTNHAKNEVFIDNQIRELWINKEVEIFYNANKTNDFNSIISLVPLPKKLILPDENKQHWKQNDLIRELNNQFIQECTNNLLKEEIGG